MNNVMNIDGLLLSYIQIVGRHNGARSGPNERSLWICDRGGCELGRGYNRVLLYRQNDSVSAESASILPDLHESVCDHLQRRYYDDSGYGTQRQDPRK